MGLQSTATKKSERITNLFSLQKSREINVMSFALVGCRWSNWLSNFKIDLSWMHIMTHMWPFGQLFYINYGLMDSQVPAQYGLQYLLYCTTNLTPLRIMWKSDLTAFHGRSLTGTYFLSFLINSNIMSTCRENIKKVFRRCYINLYLYFRLIVLESRVAGAASMDSNLFVLTGHESTI